MESPPTKPAENTRFQKKPATQSILKNSALDFITGNYLDGAALAYEQRITTQTYNELRKIDNQLDSHLDGLRTLENQIVRLLNTETKPSSPELTFITTVLALESKNTPLLKQLLALAEADPDLQRGLLNAFAWTPFSFTQPLIPHLFASASPLYKLLAIHILRMHQIKSDTQLEWAITQPNKNIQAIALKTVGEVGAMDLLPLCLKLLASDNENIRAAAARTCVFLGERSQSLKHLEAIALRPSQLRQEALSLLAVFLPVTEFNRCLSSLTQQPQDKRLLITMAGELGDPISIPALLRLMQSPKLSRLAGLAFSSITGLDLVEHNLEMESPEEMATGPNDDPEDDNVESDPDEDIPWPDQFKLKKWWEHNSHAYKPGARYIMGKEITREHCLDVLEFGCQAQRKIAALHLKKMDPASPLFLIDAPAWRQMERLQKRKKAGCFHPASL